MPQTMMMVVGFALPLWVTGLLVAAFLAVCVLLMLTILIQKPAGGGLAGAFGSGAGSGQTAFGTKTGDALTIATITMFAVYILFAIGLNFATRPSAATQIIPEAQPSPTGSTGAPGPTGPAPASSPPATATTGTTGVPAATASPSGAEPVPAPTATPAPPSPVPPGQTGATGAGTPATGQPASGSSGEPPQPPR